MTKVFISYRRDDSADVAGRIYDHLVRAYGPDNVVRDVDSILPGIDSPAFLDDAVGRCQVLLAVIGREWLHVAGPSGGRRLDDAGDLVRLEIEAALRRDIPVIPVLVRGAAMPGYEQLPESLRPLAFRQAIEVRNDPDFHRDLNRLIGDLEHYQTSDLGPRQPASAEAVAAIERPNVPATEPPLHARGAVLRTASMTTGKVANNNVVMISSTARDLPAHRQEVMAACLSQHFFPRMMEHLSASDADAVAASLRMVDEAAVYVGIFAHRYGYVPAGHTISITEMEHNRAAERGIPRLIFFIHDQHPLLAGDVETGPGAEKLKALKERLGTERVAGFFKSPEDLRAQVISSLAALREQTRPAPAFPLPAAGQALPPRPHYRDALMREVGERSEELRRRRRELLLGGGDAADVAAVEAELLDLKRRLREGPRLAAGDCLSDRYLLIEELGSGGFATVWKAFDEEHGRLVALKLLHGQYADNPERRERFRRGARAMQGLVHRHVTRILEPYREDGGHHYFVMEFVPGGTFLQAVLAGKVAGRQVGRLILHVGSALSFAHGRGVIHRDVTPDNILLDGEGSARLTDFDLVRLADSTGGTRTGALGKFVYAAPESLESAGRVDERCDVYSLGMTALFGYHGQRLPPAAFTRQSAFLKRLDLPGRLKAVLARAIRHEPAGRYGTVKEFCEALRAVYKKRSRPETPADRPGATPPATAREVPPRGVPLQAELTNSLGMKLVLVQRGTFWMGDRGSQRPVEVRHDFYLVVFPVTQGQWQEVMGSNPSYFARGGGGADKVRGISDADLKQFPVEQVSCEDVQQFLEWLNAREKSSGFLYRLPTEAEWEYSCRGGAFSSQKECDFDFYFGDPARNLSQPTNDLSSEQANFDGDYPAGKVPKGKYLERPTKVGSYKPNRLGIYDLHGNVWEWCEDHFGAGGSARVIRGGGWGAGAAHCRASYRGSREPARRFHYLGFRLAAVPSGE